MFGDEDEPDFTGGPGPSKRPKLYATPDADQQCAPVRRLHRLPFAYKPEDLYPTEKDPLCKPDWPLAAYWPVYVANFRLLEWNDDHVQHQDGGGWYDQISEYFAYHGLLTRMVVFHRDSVEMLKYQEPAHVTDMLVYFVSKADAERAIATCHRDSYYGYTLTVLSGRSPEYFVNERSIRFDSFGRNQANPAVEVFMEEVMSLGGRIEQVSRLTAEVVVIQFASVQEMIAGISFQRKWKPTLVAPWERIVKQRFLEEDVRMGIMWAMEENGSFMDMQPKANVLQELYEGYRPQVDTSWQGHARAQLSTNCVIRIQKRREERMTFQRKSKERYLAGKTKPDTVKKNDQEKLGGEVDDTQVGSAAPAASMQAGAAATAVAPPAPKHKTKTQHQTEVMNAVNYVRRRHGLPKVTREFLTACEKQYKLASIANKTTAVGSVPK